MRIGTRRSALALAQARLVAEQLGDCEIIPILTSGDRKAREGQEAGEDGSVAGEDGSVAGEDGSVAGEDKSRWVKELELALARGEIDLAVHSAKDVPGELADGLSLLGAPSRGPAADVLCGAASLDALPMGARVGTSSVRRAAQVRATREDLEIVPIRGNVDTRLRRLASGGGPQALVLAAAGLWRLGRESEIGAELDPERFVPAPGQGILALEGRADDPRVSERVESLTDRDAFACLLAERGLARGLSATCHTPLGAYAVPTGGGSLYLRAWVGLPDGTAWVSDELRGNCDDPAALGRRVAERLDAAGAGELLGRAEEMAGVGSS
jgi:hydroxymethylbilane synthase